MTWYRQLKFSSNPLDSRPNANLIGLIEQEEQLRNHILKEEICFLQGFTGSGKSSLLQRIAVTMKHHKFIYLDAHALPADFNLAKELGEQRSFFDRVRLRRMPSKTPVLIIDEFQATDPDLILDARGRWENANARQIKSIVIAQIDPHLKNVTPSFLERIGTRIIHTPVLDNEDMIKILDLRLYNPHTKVNHIKQISTEALQLIAECADGNPRRLLEYTDMLFDFHHRKFSKVNPLVHKADYQITYWGAKEILALNKVNVASYEDKKKRKGLRQESRREGSFTKLFNEQEQQLLKYFMTGAKTIEEVAEYFKCTEEAARSRINSLVQKQAVVAAGQRDRRKLWRAAPHVKRMTVHV